MDSGWLRLQFRVDASYFEKISDLLEACLALSVSIENDGEDEFFEVAFPERPTWKKIRVSALFHDTVDIEAIINFVNDTLFPDNPAPAIAEKVQDQDWVRVWLDQYKPLAVTKDLWVVPSWLKTPQKNATNIRIDPGLAFGTGTHTSTYLCLEYLASQTFENKNILDFGAGSGILAIACLLKGASQAIAVDIDPLAVKASQDNGQLNCVSENLLSLTTQQFLDSQYFSQQYSIVIANILAEVLIDNAKMLLESTKPDGVILLSGILVEQQAMIESVFSKYADCRFNVVQQSGWLLMVVEKSIF